MSEKELFNISFYSNIEYLEKILSQIKDDKKIKEIKKMFNLHMKEIAVFCKNNFEKKLSQNFIR
jgi:uncharacterized alkaline shock family protein YloU